MWVGETVCLGLSVGLSLWWAATEVGEACEEKAAEEAAEEDPAAGVADGELGEKGPGAGAGERHAGADKEAADYISVVAAEPAVGGGVFRAAT